MSLVLMRFQVMRSAGVETEMAKMLVYCWNDVFSPVLVMFMARVRIVCVVGSAIMYTVNVYDMYIVNVIT